MNRLTATLILLALAPAAAFWFAGAARLAAQETVLPPGLKAGFRWQTGPPVALPRDVEGISCYSIKDPSIVRYDGRWHLFCTIRGQERSHAVVYLSFADFGEADGAERRVLSMHDGYFCAPQVFYFEPQQRWYLICQAASDAWEPNYQPAFSVARQVDDPHAWSPLKPLFDGRPANVRAWLDFWVICDEAHAYLFFTSLDGRMWRCRTALDDFPHRWSSPEFALQGDVFEASHTYRLQGSGKYLTLIEAQNGRGWRYYKAYLADRLDGAWRPLAADQENAFASMGNVAHPESRWTDSISHSELLRSGYDQRLDVDPAGLRLLFQGVLDRDRQGKAYGQIPWRLGILQPADP